MFTIFLFKVYISIGSTGYGPFLNLESVIILPDNLFTSCFLWIPTGLFPRSVCRYMQTCGGTMTNCNQSLDLCIPRNRHQILRNNNRLPFNRLPTSPSNHPCMATHPPSNSNILHLLNFLVLPKVLPLLIRDCSSNTCPRTGTLTQTPVSGCRTTA